MAYCPNCGSEVQGRFCAKCGSAVPAAPAGGAAAAPGAAPSAGPVPGGAPSPGPASGAQPYGGQQPYGGAQPYGTQQPYGGAQPYGAGPTPVAAGGLTENVAGALCYVLGLLTGIIFLVLAPYNQSKFVRFHAFQSIFFNVAWIGFWIVLDIAIIVLRTVISAFSLILLPLFPLVGLAGLLIWLFLLYKAYSGEKFKLPLIGDLAEKQA